MQTWLWIFPISLIVFILLIFVGTVSGGRPIDEGVDLNGELLIARASYFGEPTITQLERAGRHRADDELRELVPVGWVPPIGDARVQLITTETAEYAIIRKPRVDPYLQRRLERVI